MQEGTCLCPHRPAARSMMHGCHRSPSSISLTMCSPRRASQRASCKKKMEQPASMRTHTSSLDARSSANRATVRRAGGAGTRMRGPTELGHSIKQPDTGWHRAFGGMPPGRANRSVRRPRYSQMVAARCRDVCIMKGVPATRAAEEQHPRGRRPGPSLFAVQLAPVPLRIACRTFGVHVYYTHLWCGL
jgi:hypothetical protein